MESKDLMIVVYPTRMFRVIVTEGEDAQQVTAAQTPLPLLSTTVETFLDLYEIDTVSMIGNLKYCTKIAQQLSQDIGREVNVLDHLFKADECF